MSPLGQELAGRRPRPLAQPSPASPASPVKREARRTMGAVWVPPGRKEGGRGPGCCSSLSVFGLAVRFPGLLLQLFMSDAGVDFQLFGKAQGCRVGDLQQRPLAGDASRHMQSMSYPPAVNPEARISGLQAPAYCQGTPHPPLHC